jgi:hypothetical protein
VYDPNVEPTIKDIDDAADRYLAYCELEEGENVYLNVHLTEVVRHYDDGRPPSYRRVRIVDGNIHPGALESLVRHTAEDLAREQHPTSDPNSGQFLLPRRSG